MLQSTFNEIDTMLAALLEEHEESDFGLLNLKEAAFVDDTIMRLGDYGVNTYLSEKQLRWIRDLHEKHVKIKEEK